MLSKMDRTIYNLVPSSRTTVYVPFNKPFMTLRIKDQILQSIRVENALFIGTLHKLGATFLTVEKCIQ